MDDRGGIDRTRQPDRGRKKASTIDAKLQQLYRPVKEPLQKGFANDPVMMRTQA
jgi:hypothetical protein